MQPDLLTLPNFPRAADYGGVWAIEPGAAAALVERAKRMDLFAHVAESKSPKLEAKAESIPTAGQGGTIAAVMLTGVLMKAIGSASDGTSTVEARRAIRQAAADPDVAAILLMIDSPGGSINGTADLAADVKAASAKKPVFAFIDDLGASAAYWVASQADKVYANTGTAQIGSIGTLSMMYDLSGQAEKEGIKVFRFGTGPLKGMGQPGVAVTEDMQTYMQAMVEDSQVMFDAAVKKGRGLTDKRLAEVKTGGVFLAGDALALGLIDGIKSFDAVVSELAGEARKRGKSSSTTRAESPVPIRSATMQTETTAAPVATETAVDPIAKIRADAAAEYTRIAGIQAKCGKHAAIVAEAIAQNWSVEKAELAAMRADLPTGVGPGNPHVITGKGKWSLGSDAAPGVKVNEAIEAAMQMQMGRPVEKTYRPEVLQAAHESFKDIGLQGAIMLAAIQNGYPGRPGEKVTRSNFLSVIRHAKGLDGNGLMASSSTIGMSGILGNVANKEIVAGYMEEDDSWRQIAAIKSVSNFQQVTTYRMLDDMEFEELGPNGKIKHGTAGEESYTRQVKTYAKMFGVSRKNIIDDDLGAFDDVRTRIGRGQGKKLSKVFWTAFMSALGTLFTTARTNYISGATTNLGTDGVGLGLGVLNFRKMTSPNGVAPTSADGGKRVNANTQNPVGANPGGRPEILLVPPELETNAEILHKNQNLGSVGNSTANIHANKYRPVVAWQLSNASYSGYSATHWFLLNNPAFLAAMVVSFLNGQQTPTVEEQPGDFDELCYLWRAYGDFGCDTAEYLAGTMSKGAV